MISPPLIIFYLAVVVLALAAYRSFFSSEEPSFESTGATIVSAMYVFAYILIYAMINIKPAVP